MKFKHLVLASSILYSSLASAVVPTPAITLHTKDAGNPAVENRLTKRGANKFINDASSVEINVTQNNVSDSVGLLTLNIKALKQVNFNVSLQLNSNDINHATADFVLPGLWYKQNRESTEGSVSMNVSDNWMIREDRLSTPLTAVYSSENQKYFTLTHLNKIENDVLQPYQNEDVIIYGKADIGSVGFGKLSDGNAYLKASYPVIEEPNVYSRKLTLSPSIRQFMNLYPGQEIELVYEIKAGTAASYSNFMRQLWQSSYDNLKPEVVTTRYTELEVKKWLSEFYKQSYIGNNELKGYSGIHLLIDKCEQKDILEVGFIGRVLLNAYYALEYGESIQDAKLIDDAKATFDSYLAYGFTPNGYFREVVDYEHNKEERVHSIRRQSEAAFAVLYYLEYEKSKGRRHPEWEMKIRSLLDKILLVQRADDSFPRKFTDDGVVIDETGRSSSCAVLPLTMAYKYFKDKKYLVAAEKVANYMKVESIDKGEYFSSTLDARCEDKEAGIYITTAYYYLWLATGKKESKYIDYAAQSVYFALSYYYLWDVPFAKGQMLGDLGLQTRGWGNVSVENNHIDVYIFEFIDVMNWIGEAKGDQRLIDFGKVIKSSMQDQLLPTPNRLCGINKVGYYPEVVQHTNWDYGVNGKGYYNNYFAPGWVVASLWTMLNTGQTENYFVKTKSKKRK